MIFHTLRVVEHKGDFLPHAHRSAGVRFPLLVLVLLSCLGAGPVRAASPVGPAHAANPDPAPSFFLEKITVAGNRRPASARIVLSESLLKEGQSYGEDDLRVAIRRIKRLPFVIEASFALRKGTERGRYELVITVEETRPLFADVKLQPNVNANRIEEDLPIAQHRVDFGGESLLGFREFVGSTGLIFATLGSSNSFSQVGYTRYDLFGGGSFASVALAYDPNSDTYTPSLSAGLPLTVNQSLRATVSRLRSTFKSGSFRLDEENRSAQLDWLYNTTDDPLFPTQGNEAEVDFVYQSLDDHIKEASQGSFRLGEHIHTLTLTGRHHLPLTARQSLSLGLIGSTYRYTTFEPFFTSRPSFGYQGTFEVVHAVDLWQGERARHWGDFRLETTGAYVLTSTAPIFNANGYAPVYQLAVRTALVYRSPWAVVRLGLVYSGKVRR
jgi:hypothetical protein